MRITDAYLDNGIILALQPSPLSVSLWFCAGKPQSRTMKFQCNEGQLAMAIAGLEVKVLSFPQGEKHKRTRNETDPPLLG